MAVCDGYLNSQELLLNVKTGFCLSPTDDSHVPHLKKSAYLDSLIGCGRPSPPTGTLQG